MMRWVVYLLWIFEMCHGLTSNPVYCCVWQKPESILYSFSLITQLDVLCRKGIVCCYYCLLSVGRHLLVCETFTFFTYSVNFCVNYFLARQAVFVNCDRRCLVKLALCCTWPGGNLYSQSVHCVLHSFPSLLNRCLLRSCPVMTQTAGVKRCEGKVKNTRDF